jgi:hypothetical protein
MATNPVRIRYRTGECVPDAMADAPALPFPGAPMTARWGVAASTHFSLAMQAGKALFFHG